METENIFFAELFVAIGNSGRSAAPHNKRSGFQSNKFINFSKLLARREDEVDVVKTRWTSS